MTNQHHPGPDAGPAVQRRWLLVVMCMLVGTAAAGVFVSVRTPVYASTALIRLTGSTTGGTGTNPSDGFTLPDPVQQVGSTAVQQQAAGILGVAGGALGAEPVATAYDPASGAVTIVARASSPRRAQALARAYSEAYVDEIRVAAVTRSDELATEIGRLATRITELQAEPGSDTDTLTQAQITAATQTYSTLQTEQYAIQVGQPFATIEVVAGLPGTPVGPAAPVVVVLGAAVGVVVGMAMVLVRAGAVRRATGTPPVGAVATGPVGRQPGPRVPADTGAAASGRPEAAESESLPPALSPELVKLRAELDIRLEHAARPVVVVTSSDPGEAKSRVAADLGAAWARAGTTVVMVSADFRQPDLEALLDLDTAGAQGLSDLIRGDRNGIRRRPGVRREAPDRDMSAARRSQRTPTRAAPVVSAVDRVIVDTAVPGLRLLPAGTRLDDPSDLLSSRGMQSVLDQLLRLADVVVVDTPPTSTVRHGAVIGHLSDGPLVVVTGHDTDEATLAQTLVRLDCAGAEVVRVSFDPNGLATVDRG